MSLVQAVVEALQLLNQPEVCSVLVIASLAEPTQNVLTANYLDMSNETSHDFFLKSGLMAALKFR